MLKNFVLALGVFCSLCSCGGGGSSDFVGAAVLSVEVQPNTISPGDHMQVQIGISDVHQNGIVLKVRFPDGLVYVPDSSVLEVDGSERDAAPDVNTSDGRDVYLVYYVQQKFFGEEGQDHGTLTLELRGVDTADGEVEVDADVIDSSISGGASFDVNNPNFVAEDSDWIRVRNPD